MSWNNLQDYDYTTDHSIRDWGWEFIRRNPAYMAEWKNELKVFHAKNKPRIKGVSYNGNFLDPEKYETFEIFEDWSNPSKWGLRSYQDPRAKKLVARNANSLVRKIDMSFSEKTELCVGIKPNTYLAIIDLEKPLEPQLCDIKSNAIEAQKKAMLDRPKSKEKDKKELWLNYIRCLDAQGAKVKRTGAAKVLFNEIKTKNNNQTPEQKWDETVKQANKMISAGYKKLMI